MKISAANCTPVSPQYRISLPLEWKPALGSALALALGSALALALGSAPCSKLPKSRYLLPALVNAVQSPNAPYMAATLACTTSINCATVMRLGNAWGFIMRSGRSPSAVKGMSCSGIISPMVPFCPHRLANLSPMRGLRSSRIRTLTWRACGSPAKYTWST